MRLHWLCVSGCIFLWNTDESSTYQCCLKLTSQTCMIFQEFPGHSEPCRMSCQRPAWAAPTTKDLSLTQKASAGLPHTTNHWHFPLLGSPWLQEGLLTYLLSSWNKQMDSSFTHGGRRNNRLLVVAVEWDGLWLKAQNFRGGKQGADKSGKKRILSSSKKHFWRLWG